MNTKIILEDNGQDFLQFILDDKGKIIETLPFQCDIWNGGYIPVTSPGMVKVGEQCPIHHPPYINFGYLKHKIEKIEIIEIIEN